MVKKMFLKARSLSLLLPGVVLGYGLTAQAAGPEPTNWYAGDVHAHRSCGGAPVTVSSIYDTMMAQDVAVVSLLADMGNGEVQDPVTDLPRVTGQDDPISTAGRIVHWDAEWHWDATYTQYPRQALGGHLVALGLTNAYQIWSEYTYPILNWAHQQGGIAGFVHMQYLDDGFPQSLNCCIPIEYPVEVALGACDFISEDVDGGDTFIHAYYRLLNCGFRPGFAAGSDYPCGSVIGPLLTYSRVAGEPLTYSNWIGGIARGRTAVSRNGRKEFLELKVNGSATPGDEIQLTGGGSVQVDIRWTAKQNLTGTIELVCNGEVVASHAVSGTSNSLSTTVAFSRSGWLCARRMSSRGHEFHTAAVFVTVDQKPVRASAADAQFYVQWMDNLLTNTSPGGIWSSYFVTNRAAAQARYSAAKSLYEQIASEATALQPVAIDTTSLPNGAIDTAYSTTLTASGGATPYTWSIASGSLPSGLTLDASSGAITGTPTTAETFSFTAQVSDAGTPTQTASNLFSIMIASMPVVTIWPSTAAPGQVDGGPDNAAELGVKFRSDVNGTITGIRFYKAGANTGTHVGNLWASNGLQLATVTFSNETASGWQQALFDTPVAIASNTVYVASYHANDGHYSADNNYFTGKGANNPPLHALTNSAASPNGVYAYGASSVFPNQTWNAANYWVDVVFLAGSPPPAPTLTSITVTPTNSIILTGASQQFTATGTYSDGSTQNITSQATWASSNTVVATINTAGLATGNSAGDATISAALTGVTGSALLAVQTSPLTIGTTSLSNGILNAAYVGTLRATGGTLPYTWSLAGGVLAPGLTLNGSGVITGTPTAMGTFNFTAQVRDTSSPVQTTNKLLSMTIVTVPAVTIWSNTTVPGVVDGGPDNAAELGVKFKSDVNGTITGIRFYKAGANTGTHVGNLWASNGLQLATVTFSNETASGWQQALFSTPVAIASNTVYVASYHANDGHYSADNNYFTGKGANNPPLHALTNSAASPNGVYAYGVSSVFPNQTWSAANYWVDVVFQAGPPPPPPALMSIMVTPTNSIILTGASQQFTATGTYSDGSTQNITSQATWASSNTVVATINTAGLATGNSAGDATISAALTGVTGSALLAVQTSPLTIGTTSLSNGILNAAYVGTLRATGGTLPYTWSLAGGVLAPGLTLNGSGVITGTPTAMGTFNFTAQVSDVGSPVQTTNKPLSITIASAPVVVSTIWSNTTVPGQVDGGPDNAAELGVKFRSDVNGTITGIRFYKAGANTGTHVGNLWASNGLQLATVTFSNETASGWQQALFNTPVAITSNTVYVASYHANNGHYSGDNNYFQGKGADNPPLHALTNSAATPNGVYAYGSGSVFPNQTWSAANYWVDVVFQAGPITLTSIAVTPTNSSIWAGVSQQFTATGTYSDGSTQNLSNQVTWTSLNAGVATINTNGLATGVSTGTTTISAAMAGVTGSSLLTVQFSPLAIGTTFLPNGTVSMAYSTMLTASGGTLPYIWSVADGSLPSGLTLNANSGAITGTPTSMGTFSFTARVMDAGTPAQTTNKQFSITILPSLFVTTTYLPNGVVDVAYTEALTASGGTLPYTWSVAGGSLPSGLTLSSTSGEIAGTPTTTGTFSFIAQVSDYSTPVKVASNLFTITVTTASSRPILVLTNAANPFSQYYAEILLTEGLSAFELKDISSVSSATLALYDVVILGQVALQPSQVSIVSNWVNAGGNLIAMRPDKKLAGLLGLVDAGATISEGYLLVNTSTGPGVGIVGETIQFHGTADCYTLGSASNLATLYSNAQTATINPAVTLRSVGPNGGQAAAFTYDLARSIVYTRQGNPAWAGQVRDGIPPCRSDDLFYGAASYDPQPDWIDLSKVAIPQADEQQRLLANMIITMDSDKNLLPRFWYFPHGYEAVVVMTGDNHGGNGTAGRFDQYMALSPTNGSVDDWETIRSTSYIYPISEFTDAQAFMYDTNGFEIALHLSTACADWTPASLVEFFDEQLYGFKAAYPSLPSQTTLRNHCIAWSDYATMPQVELSYGIRLDLNYYYWPSNWVANRPGFFTGSGMPMRFATATGNVIDVYQAASVMTDESGQSYPYTVDSLLDRALGPEGYYGAFVANMHTDWASSSESDAIIASAIDREVPVISARQLLTWLDARNASSLKSIDWNNSRQAQTFSVNADAKARGLLAMAPVPVGYSASAVKYNGSPIGYYLRGVKGFQYAIFPVTNGDYEVSYVTDNIPPSVTEIVPTNGQSGVGLNAKVSVTFSESMNALTINTNTITLRDSLNNPVAATVSYNASTFTAVLTPSGPLAISTAYTATVKGGAGGVTDATGNPRTNDLIWSFTTTNTFFSIWSNTAAPGLVDGGSAGAAELGVKFKSDVTGTVTGIRFYKAAANTGAHIGNLWTSTGTRLATTTFTNETATGWQQALFATPVGIASNTVYVASYHANNGHYSADLNYFQGKGVDNPPLHALTNGVSGGNGVYRNGTSSAFPNKTSSAANYWVDVVFKTR